MDSTIIYIIVGIAALIVGLLAGKIAFAKNNDKQVQEAELEAKKDQLMNWAKSYFGIQSVRIDYKKKGETPTNELCLVFQVDKKDSAIDSGKIPTTIQYDSADGRQFDLPTDVEPVGQTVSSSYVPGKAKVICLSSPKQPGWAPGNFGSDGMGGARWQLRSSGPLIFRRFVLS